MFLCLRALIKSLILLETHQRSPCLFHSESEFDIQFFLFFPVSWILIFDILYTIFRFFLLLFVSFLFFFIIFALSNYLLILFNILQIMDKKFLQKYIKNIFLPDLHRYIYYIQPDNSLEIFYFTCFNDAFAFCKCYRPDFHSQQYWHCVYCKNVQAHYDFVLSVVRSKTYVPCTR